MTRVQDQYSSLKKTFSWGLAYSFRGSVHDHHGREYGTGQAGMVLEQRTHIWSESYRQQEGETEPPTPVTYLLQKSYILFKDSYREREVENKEKLGLSLGMTMFIHGEGSFCHPSVDSQNAYRKGGMWPLIGMEMTSVACKGSWEV